jgi:hypothetical protein
MLWFFIINGWHFFNASFGETRLVGQIGANVSELLLEYVGNNKKLEGFFQNLGDKSQSIAHIISALNGIPFVLRTFIEKRPLIRTSIGIGLASKLFATFFPARAPAA